MPDAAAPIARPRRLRRTPGLRRVVSETSLAPADLMLPLFVHERAGRAAVESMPGVFRHDLASLIDEAGRALELGVPAIVLFGIPDAKDAVGSGAHDDAGIVQRATRELKRQLPDIVVVADTCLCEYTDHGHCGPLDGDTVQNDAALELLARTAVSQARAGADLIAPSASMDGMVGAIRTALDLDGLAQVPILSYAVKYASAFYGPFRDAAGSAPGRGDRAGYQMDPRGGLREARREARLDLEQGADMLMVKPALAYLDVLAELRATFDLPVVAYSVSGEYAMLKAAAERGWLDERRSVLEALVSIRRAGADAIITYHAVAAARWLRDG